jgi:hypothetical protein
MSRPFDLEGTRRPRVWLVLGMDGLQRQRHGPAPRIEISHRPPLRVDLELPPLLLVDGQPLGVGGAELCLALRQHLRCAEYKRHGIAKVYESSR